MNIHIHKEPNSKGVYLKVSLDGLEPLWFYRDGASKLETQLLNDELYRQFSKQLEELRKVSYLRGWRDAKAKRVKTQFFADVLFMTDHERKAAGL